jgi:hypothetical protein
VRQIEQESLVKLGAALARQEQRRGKCDIRRWSYADA